MIHHAGDVFLAKGIQGGPLGDNTADQGMVVFGSPFLIGSLRVTVKDMCPAATQRVCLNCRGIGKFAAIISEQHLKQPVEGIRTQIQIEPAEDVDDRLRGIGIPDKRKHELGHGKVQGQKNFAAFPSLYGVHFHDRKARMHGHKLQEILICSPYATLFVHLKAILLFSAFSHAHNARHVKVSSGKDAIPYIIVEGTFIHHDFICMGGAYMVKGLALYDEGTN